MSHDQPPTERTGHDRSHPTPDIPTAATAPGVGPRTPPVLRQPRWSGKKTAVVAALAIGLSSAGAIGAAAAAPSTDSGGAGFGQHARGGYGGPGGQSRTGNQGGTGAQGGTGTQNGPGALDGPGAPEGATGRALNGATTTTT